MIASNKSAMQYTELNRSDSRKKRTHELIETGAIVTSVIGFSPTEKNRQAFRDYLYQHRYEILRLMPDKAC